MSVSDGASLWPTIRPLTSRRNGQPPSRAVEHFILEQSCWLGEWRNTSLRIWTNREASCAEHTERALCRTKGVIYPSLCLLPSFRWYFRADRPEILRLADWVSSFLSIAHFTSCFPLLIICLIYVSKWQDRSEVYGKSPKSARIKTWDSYFSTSLRP